MGEGNGNPLQCSCLGNPRDGGARWAAVYGVAQNQTRLKQLSIIIIIIFPFLKDVLETVYLRLGLKPTWQGLCLCNIQLGLELAKTHGAWLQDLMKLRFLMSHRKNSVRDTVIGKR